MRWHTRGLVAAVCLFVLASPVSAQSKVTIVTTQPGLNLFRYDAAQKTIGDVVGKASSPFYTCAEKVPTTDKNGKALYWYIIRDNGIDAVLAADGVVVLDAKVGSADDPLTYFKGKALENPKDAFPVGRLALVFELKGELDAAIRFYTDAIRLQPTEPAWWHNRGMCYAEPDIIKVNAAQVGLARAALLKTLKPAVAAIAGASAAVVLDTNELAAADAHKAAEKAAKVPLDRAILDFDEAIRLNEKFVLGYLNRGRCMEAQGKYREALLDYQSAIVFGRDNPVGYSAMAWLLATCPDSTIRNSSEAVSKAIKACQLTKFNSSEHLDTLAAALARYGFAPTAWMFQSVANALHAGCGMPAEYDLRRNLYFAGIPYPSTR
jgi:tetratricopeptide (TPR) repeat protein